MKDIKAILKNPKLVITVSVILLVLIEAAFGRFLIWPEAKNYNEARNESKENQIKLEELTKSVDNLRLIGREDLEIFSRFNQAFFPSSPDILRFFALAETIADISQVSITQISARGASPSSKDATGKKDSPEMEKTAGYTLDGSVKGSYPTIINFLSSLNTLARAVGVTKFSIGSTGETELSAVVNFVLPLSSATLVVSSDEFVSLSEEERESLEILRATRTIDASPATATV